jgi:hypothetical protein
LINQFQTKISKKTFGRNVKKLFTRFRGNFFVKKIPCLNFGRKFWPEILAENNPAETVWKNRRFDQSVSAVIYGEN